jgi:hypothetical protein
MNFLPSQTSQVCLPCPLQARQSTLVAAPRRPCRPLCSPHDYSA